MRTNIEIDDKLMKEAMKALGVTTKKAAVETALRQALEIHGQQSFRKLRGKVAWRSHDNDWLASDEQIADARKSEKTEVTPAHER